MNSENLIFAFQLWELQEQGLKLEGLVGGGVLFVKKNQRRVFKLGELFLGWGDKLVPAWFFAPDLPLPLFRAYCEATGTRESESKGVIRIYFHSPQYDKDFGNFVLVYEKREPEYEDFRAFSEFDSYPVYPAFWKRDRYLQKAFLKDERVRLLVKRALAKAAEAV